jgi:hypothetical protein
MAKSENVKVEFDTFYSSHIMIFNKSLCFHSKTLEQYQNLQEKGMFMYLILEI